MAMISKSIEIAVGASVVWDAARDVGNLHTRLVPGLVADCQLSADGSERLVTFANGTALPETIIAIDEDAMRVVWTARSDAWVHHNGALEITAIDDANSSVCWTADVLPHEAADAIAPIMEAGLATMKNHLEDRSDLKMQADPE